MTTRALLCMLTLTVMLATPAFANQLPKEGDPSCQDSELLSVKLITEICWECLFPIRVAGVSLGSGTVPTGASNQSVCWCDDALGVPHPIGRGRARLRVLDGPRGPSVAAVRLAHAGY